MKIYVSSTFEDLKEFRQEVYRQLRKLRTDVVSMEDYTAGEKRPLAKCIEDIAESDLYIGIFAWRYGYIPKEAANPESLSITELEYRAAGDHGKQRLIFLLRDDAAWKPGLMDTHTGEGDGGRQIERLRDELGERHGIGSFSTPDDLAKEVSAAVAGVLLRQVAQVRSRDEPTGATVAAVTPAAEPSENLDGFSLTWRALSRAAEVGRSIGRIEDGTGMPVASGFLVSGASLHRRLGTDLYLLTPAHIIVREKSQQTFGLTVDEASFRLTIPDEAAEPIRLAEIAWSSPVNELDVSLIRLARQPEGVSGLALAKTLPLLTPRANPLEATFGDGTRVMVVGYPGGRGLSYSLGGALLDQGEGQLQYLADTAPGSGGSAVLNESWEAIGVHRLRGKLQPLSRPGSVFACQAASLPAVREALRAEFGG